MTSRLLSPGLLQRSLKVIGSALLISCAAALHGMNPASLIRCVRSAAVLIALCCLASGSVSPVWAAFGLTSDTSHYIVDTGAGLVFKVDRRKADIRSIVFHGTELNDAAKASGLNSGLGSTGTKVTAAADSSTVIVTVTTDQTNTVVAGLTHYYIVRKGVNNLYMATYATKATSNGEMRWITRLKGQLFPTVPAESNIRNNTGNIESRDVFGMADGTSRSKYYGNQHAMDLSIRGVTGTNRGAFMVYGNRESSLGGPFFRDIQNQSGSDSEVYNYLYSGHNQTEKEKRLGVLYGPYALCFTTGATPSIPDMSFMSTLGLTGYVDSSARGRVVLNGLNDRDTNYTYTVAFANPTAQYWTMASASNGSAACNGMKPGTYTMTVYKRELAVYTTSVTVTAGQTLTVPAVTPTSDPSRTVALWRIGDWDGTPLEFRNGVNIPLMHPSDRRQASWAPGTFTIGSSPLSDFPACQWVGVNGSQVVSFKLTSAQVAAHTIRIGLTAAYAAARPKITVNAWTSSTPSSSSQPDSRSLTIGTYRGNNTTYTFRVPASAFVTGTNTLKIEPISGKKGSGFLSPGYAIDCVDML